MDNFTADYINSTYYLLHNSYNSIYFNPNVTFIDNIYQSNECYNKLYGNIINDIFQITSPKTNYELLISLYPNLQEDLELYEGLSYDMDGTLYMPITTPDVKMYYPEPFIASPSFMHEEV
jgi:hypothetical protein